MPTNVDLDEKLVAEAFRATGLRTKKALIEEGLRALIRFHHQSEVSKLRGMLPWHEPGPPDPPAPIAGEAPAAKAGKGKAGADPR